MQKEKYEAAILVTELSEGIFKMSLLECIPLQKIISLMKLYHN
jgi:hypothetical protein